MNGRRRATGVFVLAVALALAWAASAAGAATFSIVGRGFGHGVGMSQYGAQGFALHGWSYRRILAHYYPGTTLSRARDARVRVLLRDGLGSFAIASSAPIRVVDGGGGALRLPAGRYAFGSDLELALGGKRYRLRAPVRFEPVGAPLELDGDAYRGSLLVVWGSSGLYAIDDVPVDEYVRGSVSWEMPSTWSQQALRAQAVAARSYALAAVSPGRLFDLFPDTRSQMYGGVRAETAATDAAVAATRGQVIAWQGRVAIAFYSSTSGGCTAALADGMPGAQRLPYLRSVPDPYDSIAPEHAWGPIPVSGDRLAALFGGSSVSSVRVVRNGSGRVATVVLDSAVGSREVSGSTFARTLGLRSTWFDVESGGGASFRGCSAHGRRAPLPPRAAAHDPVRPLALEPRQAPDPVGWIPTAAAILAVLGLVAFLLPHRRVVALCAVLALAAVGVVRWRAPTAAPPPAAAPSVPPAHDESPGAAVAPPRGSTERLLPEISVPSAGAPEPARGTPVPTVPAVPPKAPPASPSPPPSPSAPPSPPASSAPHVAAAPPPPPAHVPAQGPRRPMPRTPKPKPPPPPVAPPPPPVAPPPPPPSEALTISDVHVDSAPGSRTFSVAWRTSVPASTVGASSSGEQPTVWTAADAGATDHVTVFSSLAPDTKYALSLHAVDQWGREQTAELEVVTPPRAPAPTAKASGGSFLVDGQPFFPVALWALCAGEVDTKLADGVNVFMTNGCGPDAELVHVVRGRALTVVDPATASEGAGGVVGWNYPDEWDNWVPTDATAETLDPNVPRGPSSLLSFLTLTNHFYSYAAPLPQGRGMYPALAQSADVVGFDLYPLQVWCKSDAFAHVFLAQRELVQLAAGKPTYQWIEAAPMEHCPQPELAPTAATVRAETWLAIAGGATGIGYFPNGWTEDVEHEIARTDREIAELAPALAAPQTNASSDQPAVQVGARVLNGAIYVVAVNSSAAVVPANIAVPELFAPALDVYGEHRQVQATNGSFTDVFQPLQVHVYIAAPPLATAAAPAQSFERFAPEEPALPEAAVGFGPMLP